MNMPGNAGHIHTSVFVRPYGGDLYGQTELRDQLE